MSPTAPSAPSPPPATSAPQAAPPARGPGWPAFVGSEGGLLLLSLVLAVMVWMVVRTLVVTEATVEVHVLAVVSAPERSQAAAFGPVKVRLHGKRGEVERAVAELDRQRDTVELIVAPLASGVPERPFRHGEDTYRWPFPERLLEDPARPPLPEGEVVRLERRSVTLQTPEVTTPPAWPEGLRVQAQVNEAPLEIVAPLRALDDVLVPDPIDASRHVRPNAPLTATVEVDLTFDAWRQGRSQGRIDERAARRRAAVTLPRLKATLRLSLAEKAALTNAVEVFVRRGHQVLELRPPPGTNFTGKLSVDDAAQRLDVTFTGEVRGTVEVLDDLREHPDGWRWVLRIPDDDLPEEIDAPKTVTAVLSLVGLDRFSRLVPDGHAAFAPISFPVEVRRLR